MERSELNSRVVYYFPDSTPYSEDDNSITYLLNGNPLNLEERFSKFYEEITRVGHYPLLLKEGDDLILKVTKKAEKREIRKKFVALLFTATIASVVYTGYLSVMVYDDLLNMIRPGHIPYPICLNVCLYTLAVLTPLFLHELGHYITARKGYVPASFPLPIPAPVISPLGTFGAIMLMKYLPKNIRDLVRLGISGPLVGVTLSVAVFGISYLYSPIIPISALQGSMSRELISPVRIAPLSALLISTLRPLPTGFTVLMNPAAEAAYLILLIHFANLLPIGQLDGGHVIRALTSIKIHYWVSIIVSALAIVYSLASPEMGWLALFVVLAWVLSGTRPHLGSANLMSRLNRGERVKFAALYAALLLATFPVTT